MSDFIDEKISKYFTSDLYEQKTGIIKLCFVREVINPMVDRSDDSEDVISFRNSLDREVVTINSRKIKSKDKLFGLQLARNNEGTEKDSKYNEMPLVTNLANINSILYGDTAVGDGAAGLKARCYYDWAYSIRDISDITEVFQHNSITESGGIMATQDVGSQKKGQLRSNALFTTKYVLPNTYFPHFITMTDVTKDMFLHGLFSMLQSKAYGGQTTVQGSVTMQNHLVAIVVAKYEQPINSLKISQTYETIPENLSFENIKEKTIQELQKYYVGDSKILMGDDLNKLVNSTIEFFSTDLKEFYKKTKVDSEEYLKQVGYATKKK